MPESNHRPPPPTPGHQFIARPAQQGWVCPQCKAVWSPWVVQCPSCVASPPIYPLADCSCPEYGTCMNTACPRRIQVTSALRPTSPEEVQRMLDEARARLAEEGED